MHFKILILLAVGLIPLTAQGALGQDKKSPSSSAQEEDTSQRHLELLGKINSINEIFDNYHLGSAGVTYEGLSDKKRGK